MFLKSLFYSISSFSNIPFTINYISNTINMSHSYTFNVERLGSDPNAPKCTICLAGSPYSLQVALSKRSGLTRPQIYCLAICATVAR